MDTQKKKPLTYIIGASLSVALGISSSLISFYYTVQKPTPSLGLNIETFIRSANENELTQKKFEENRKFIIQANDIANSIKSDLNDPQVINSLKLSEINDRIDSLNNKITNLYQAIDSSPEKSLSIPSINKDIHSLDEKIKYISDNFEHQIDRAYQILMWVCGTLVIGMITLIITIWLSMRSKP